jgi:hypothetical protein
MSMEFSKAAACIHFATYSDTGCRFCPGLALQYFASHS